MKYVLSNINQYFITDELCENLVLSAKVNNVGEILVGPSSVPSVLPLLNDSNIELSVAVAYPSGCYDYEEKVSEINELEKLYPSINNYYVVLSEAKFLEGKIDYTKEGLAALIQCVGDKKLYIIVEIKKMSDEQVSLIKKLCKEVGVQGIPLSTGFYPYADSFGSIDQMCNFKEIGDSIDVVTINNTKADDEKINPTKVIISNYFNYNN